MAGCAADDVTMHAHNLRVCGLCMLQAPFMLRTKLIRRCQIISGPKNLQVTFKSAGLQGSKPENLAGVPWG